MERKIKIKAARAALLAAGLGLVAYSLTGPQVFDGYSEIFKSGIDIYILLDTSKSMLVTDIAPDRITVAKKIASGLTELLNGDRIGFIPFASDAYIQMPLTDDYGMARMFLDVTDTDMIGGGGTSLASAIQLACDSFTRSNGADRAIIIISDGEEHDGAALSMLKNTDDNRLKVYTVGVGTEKGGLVPVYDAAGDTVVDYMRDGTGNPVTSRLNQDVLKQLAREGGGAYYKASLQGIETESLIKDMSALKRGEREAERSRRFKPVYQYFLAPGLLLFLAAWFLPDSFKENDGYALTGVGGDAGLRK
jgi:Ca-activated chloride channel family protein